MRSNLIYSVNIFLTRTVSPFTIINKNVEQIHARSSALSFIELTRTRRAYGLS